MSMQTKRDTERDAMHDEQAECDNLHQLLSQLGEYLEQYLRFEHPDAMRNANEWQASLGGVVPEQGIGARQVIETMGKHVIPNGSPITRPGCTSFITTGATSIGALAMLSGSIASPQRIGLTAFNYLEQLSLQWMAEMFELPAKMQGLYSSGGSVANLVALGGARQSAFERLGLDPARDGIQKPCRIYASSDSHNTINRAAAVLGMGRNAVVSIPVDGQGRLQVKKLRERMQADASQDVISVAVVANAGSTGTGAIDPLREMGEIAAEFSTWFHIDGAYGLPGILDPEVRPLYDGLSLADSVIVDPHKWLGAPVGIGATYVRDYGILQRAFTQEDAHYLEGSVYQENLLNSMDSLGIPYADFGVELSAPSRGAVVWALIKEIGKNGLCDRVCRHIAMAQFVAEQARLHPNLELVQEPTLSICCFRYISHQVDDLNQLNRRIHRQLIHNGRNIPSTTLIDDKIVIRPCFIGARTGWQQAIDLVEEVLETGHELAGNNAAK